MIVYFSNWILYSNENEQSIAAFNSAVEGPHKQNAE